MKIEEVITLYAGGPGSGRHDEGSENQWVKKGFHVGVSGGVTLSHPQHGTIRINSKPSNAKGSHYSFDHKDTFGKSKESSSNIAHAKLNKYIKQFGTSLEEHNINNI